MNDEEDEEDESGEVVCDSLFHHSILSLYAFLLFDVLFVCGFCRRKMTMTSR